MEKVYVLCKKYLEVGGVTFVCGPDPGGDPTFDPTPERAARFETPGDALLYRSLLSQKRDNMEEYRLHELLPDGQLVDIEA